MDFYDKLITSIVCILVTIVCLFNTFCFASSDVEISGSFIPNSKIEDGFIVSSGSSPLIYFETLYPGSYTLINNTSFGHTVFATSDNIVEIGSSVFNIGYISPDSSFDFVVPDNQTFVLAVGSDSVSNYILIYHQDLHGISLAVNSLVNNVGINDLWGVFELSVPYVLIVVVVGFGFYMILTLVRKLQKGKARL